MGAMVSLRPWWQMVRIGFSGIIGGLQMAHREQRFPQLFLPQGMKKGFMAIMSIEMWGRNSFLAKLL